jgi:hypothetical protein
MKPSTRQAVEHKAWARGTRGPEMKYQDQGQRGPGPGSQNQGAVDPEGKTGTQTRTDRTPRLENNRSREAETLG